MTERDRACAAVWSIKTEGKDGAQRIHVLYGSPRGLVTEANSLQNYGCGEVTKKKKKKSLTFH